MFQKFGLNLHSASLAHPWCPLLPKTARLRLRTHKPTIGIFLRHGTSDCTAGSTLRIWIIRYTLVTECQQNCHSLNRRVLSLSWPLVPLCDHLDGGSALEELDYAVSLSPSDQVALTIPLLPIIAPQKRNGCVLSSGEATVTSGLL